MALAYLWCYQVEKESYLSKLVESNKEITSSKGACSCFIFLGSNSIKKNSVVIFFFLFTLTFTGWIFQQNLEKL